MEEMNITTIRKCPVCSTQKGLLLHRIKYPADKDRILPVDYRIIGCQACGMVYDDFDADEKVFAKHYELDGKYEMSASGGAGGSSVEDLKHWKKILDTLTPYLKNREVSVLDIGCGKGGLLQFFRENGFHDLFGIDASPGCIEFIRKNYLFPVQCCNANEFHSDRKFNIIFSSYVLEHLYFCRSYLNSIRSLLTADGFLYLEVPDASGYSACHKLPFYFFDHEHINHFQPDSLRNLLNECGFSVMKLEQFTAEPVAGFYTPNIAVLAIPGPMERDLVPNDYSAVVEYIQESRKQDQAIRNLPEMEGRGYLWGIGAFCQRLLESGAFSKLNLCGLIDLDTKKQGKSIQGLPVSSPEILKDEPENSFVIITSVLYEREIREMLHALRYKGKIIVIQNNPLEK